MHTTDVELIKFTVVAVLAMDCYFWCYCFIFIHVTIVCWQQNKTDFCTLVLTLAHKWSRTLNQFQQRDMQKTDSWNSYQHDLQKTSQHWISYLNKKHPLSIVNHRTISSRQIQTICMHNANQTSCRRAATTVCPHPSPPNVGAKVLCATDIRQRSSSFPRPPLQPPDAPTRLCVSAVIAVNG